MRTNIRDRKGSGQVEELAFMSAAELSQEIRLKRIAPTDVIEYFIKRIEQRNPSINAMVSTNFEHALQQARLLEADLAAGRPVGVFAGVPTAMKDFLPGKPGWHGTCGGIKALSGPDPAYSNFCFNMEKAGAIMMGKTNAPAMAFRATCDNYLYGPTSTPFKVGRNSGGSSGGAAAAVADGILPIAEGTDGGGSIRIPAAWCGCYGYKASVGTIPSVARPNGFCESHPYTFDGVLTRTVEDSALALTQMAGYDPRDPLSIDYHDRDFMGALNGSVKGWKIGFTADFGVFPTEPEIARIVERAALRFREAGAVVEEVKFSFPRTSEEMAAAWGEMININSVLSLAMQKEQGIDLLGKDRSDIPPELAEAIELTCRSSMSDYVRWEVIRTEIYDQLQTAFETYDLIISPTLCCDPPQNTADGNTLGPETVNGIKVNRLIGYCQTFFMNFTGHPAASVPAGLSALGVPVGMQIVGRRFRDVDVLAASAVFERIQPWRDLYQIPWHRPL